MRSSSTTAQVLLIVDDDSVNIELIYNAFADEELDIVIANSGEAALRLAGADPPDLVLLDIVMPGLDGFEVCKRLKERAETRDTPVIFMTAHDDLERRMQAFRLGAIDVVQKPFDMPELVARVRTQLSIRSMTSTLKQQNKRLEHEIRERTAAEAQREQLTHTLLRRTEELRAAKELLERELHERERAEAARNELQQRIIAVQQERLVALSTPLIPITRDILVMPLIGALDGERMRRVMETALHGASARGAGFVILDLTGVQDIEPGVVPLFVRIGDGLRLLGASAIVTGMSPNVARALVSFDASLRSLTMRATLMDGITHAMQRRTAARE